RPVDLERRPCAVADRRRQGHEADGRALPAAARSAREVATHRAALRRASRGARRLHFSTSRLAWRDCQSGPTALKWAELGPRPAGGALDGSGRSITGEETMTTRQRLYLSVAAVGLLGWLAGAPAQLGAQTTVAIDNDDIGGVVTGASGPEAGVWVIAETTDLPTRYIKSVVTDDRGRYVIPDLPSANYDVWVRGYGLVDSPKMRA